MPEARIRVSSGIGRDVAGEDPATGKSLQLERCELHGSRERVGMTGLEPALLSELEPKSSASASFATSPTLYFTLLFGFCKEY